jgi:exodeoxyribonuclease VII small subunit
VPKTAAKTAPTGDPESPGVDALSYEQAREELLDIVRALEAGGTTLEESLALWERGEALAARCQAWLDGARATLDAAAGRTTSPEGDAGAPGRLDEDED